MATKRVVPNELSHHDSWNGNDRSGDTAHFAQVSSGNFNDLSVNYVNSHPSKLW